MTTLTIEISPRLEKALTMLIEQIGGKILTTGTKRKRTVNMDDENLTPAELELFNKALKEAYKRGENQINSFFRTME